MAKSLSRQRRAVLRLGFEADPELGLIAVGLIDGGPVSSLADGAPRLLRTGKRDIALIAWRGEVFAIGDRCPHQGASLGRGHVSALIRAAQPKSLTLDVDHHRPVVACPWHHWEFDLRTGRAVWDSRVRVRTYPVIVSDGRAWVEIQTVQASKRA